MKKISLILLFLVCLAWLPSALAIGISPSDVTIEFSPEYETEVKYLVINNEGKDLDASLYVIGPHKEFVQLEQNSIHLEPDEYEKIFIVKIKLPEETNVCGLIAKVAAEESPPELTDDTGVVVVGRVLSPIELVHKRRACVGGEITGWTIVEFDKTEIGMVAIVMIIIFIVITALLYYKLRKRHQHPKPIKYH